MTKEEFKYMIKEFDIDLKRDGANKTKQKLELVKFVAECLRIMKK